MIFAAKFRDEMKKNGLLDKIPTDVWKQPWIVNCQATSDSMHSVKYLAPYAFKVAISNSRILRVENRMVYFKYRKSRSNRWRTTALELMEFLRRFLQHVLPAGFMKVRYYGFMNPSSSVTLDKVATLIELAFGFNIMLPKIIVEPLKPFNCAHCGGSLKYIASLLPFELIHAGAG